MPELELLRRRRDERVAEAKSMVAAATAESRDLSAEEVQKFDRLMDDADRLETVEIPAAQQRADRLARLDTVANRSVQIPTRPDLSASMVQTPQLFRSFGEQLQAVIRAGQPGGIVDPRLLQLQAAATGMSEGLASDGGFLVQTDHAMRLLEKTWEVGQLARRCDSLEIGANANGIKIPRINETSRANGSRWGGIRGYWKGEAASLTASQLSAGGTLSIDLEKLTALVYATDEMLQDAAALESWVKSRVPDELAFKLDDAIVAGSGAGMPLGILNADCTVSVAKETGQAAATIVTENISKMWARCYAPSRANAVWLIAQDAEPQFDMLSMSVGTGGMPMYMPPGGLSEAPYARLKGRPVVPIEHCKVLGTVGDIILADLSQYMLVKKGGLQSASSIHVQFAAGETVFRFVLRINGMPTWSAALTPYNTGNTLSPFVTLATRA